MFMEIKIRIVDFFTVKASCETKEPTPVFENPEGAHKRLRNSV